MESNTSIASAANPAGPVISTWRPGGAPSHGLPHAVDVAGDDVALARGLERHHVERGGAVAREDRRRRAARGRDLHQLPAVLARSGRGRAPSGRRRAGTRPPRRSARRRGTRRSGRSPSPTPPCSAGSRRCGSARRRRSGRRCSPRSARGRRPARTPRRATSPGGSRRGSERGAPADFYHAVRERPVTQGTDVGAAAEPPNSAQKLRLRARELVSAATTRGQNCVPALSSISAQATSSDIASR